VKFLNFVTCLTWALGFFRNGRSKRRVRGEGEQQQQQQQQRQRQRRRQQQQQQQQDEYRSKHQKANYYARVI